MRKMDLIGGDKGPANSHSAVAERTDAMPCKMTREEYFGYCVQCILEMYCYSYFAALLPQHAYKFPELSDDTKQYLISNDVDILEMFINLWEGNEGAGIDLDSGTRDTYLYFPDGGDKELDFLGACQGFGVGTAFPPSPCEAVREGIYIKPRYVVEPPPKNLWKELWSALPKALALANWDGTLEDESIGFFEFNYPDEKWKAIDVADKRDQEFGTLFGHIVRYLPEEKSAPNRNAYGVYLAPYVKFLNGTYYSNGLGAYVVKDGTVTPLRG